MKAITPVPQKSKYLPEVISKIKDGNCIAFIGAGFTAPAVRTWSEVLDQLKTTPILDKRVKNQLSRLLELPKEEGALFDREAAAEIIEDKLGNNFVREIRKALPRRVRGGGKTVEKRISVVTPCYNEEVNIYDVYHAIKEIRENYPQYKWEHIFIDNASVDKSLDLLKEIAHKDKQVKIIVNIANTDIKKD